MLGSDRREKGVMRGKKGIARQSESKQYDIRHVVAYKLDGTKLKEESSNVGTSNAGYR